MNNNFNNMDDLFNQLMGNMGGFRSESRRYMINGREVTPEEFAIYRQTGQLPSDGGEQAQHSQAKGMKQDGILAKLGRNLTEEAREGKLDPVIGRNKEIQETAQNRVEQIINKLKAESDLTEEMKDTDIFYWVGTMNAIKNQAEEIVFNELIYV